MNLHNTSQKSLFDHCMAPSPTISRCYSSKANVNTFTTPHHFRSNNMFSTNRFPSNIGHFNRTVHNYGPQREPLKVTSAMCKSSFTDPVKFVRCSFGDPVKIVGGFVGSKSQAGSTNHRGREFSLWDIILDKIMEVVEHPELKQVPTPKNGSRRKENSKFEEFSLFASVDGEVERVRKENWMQSDCTILDMCKHEPLNSMDCTKTEGTPGVGLVGLLNDPPNSACSKFTRNRELPTECDSTVSHFPLDTPSEPLPHPAFRDDVIGFHPQHFPESPTSKTQENNCCLPYSSSSSVSIPHVEPSRQLPTGFSKVDSEDENIPSLSSSCESQVETFLQRERPQRSISECSASSDDSFIVFENPDDETADIPDDDTVIFSDDSDDEYANTSEDEEIDELDNCILLPHNCNFSPPVTALSKLQEANQKWNEFYADVNPKSSSATGKVRFANEKDLVKVKRLVAWDFAHRAARIGPWEMYRRDSDRFKCRIASLSPVISPVLTEEHRKTVYADRFQTSSDSLV